MNVAVVAVATFIGIAVWAIAITLVDDVWLFAPLRLLGA